MTIRRFLLTLVLATLVIPSSSFAQATTHEHRATVLLRNGERVSGLVEDVENNTVFVRVSLHDQRKINVSEVALIDFAGGASGLPETELAAARGANHLALLRGGNSLQGQFVDIRGGEAGAAGETHSLIFRTADGREQSVPLDNVSRIYFGNFPNTTNVANNAPTSAVTTSSDPIPAGAVRVPANAQWVTTPYTVRKGDRVGFQVTGRVQLSDDANDVAQAAGSLTQRYAKNAPLAQNFAGALIARVGNSAPFPIGDQAAVTMPADGPLMLMVNDDEHSDNRGEFIVRITMPNRR
jgi:hypothetical protein